LTDNSSTGVQADNSKTLTNEEMQNIKGKFLQIIWSGIQAYMTVYG
jgi:bacteriocin-like protein